MRLADFIEKNLEPILVQWESFARSLSIVRVQARFRHYRRPLEHRTGARIGNAPSSSGARLYVPIGNQNECKYMSRSSVKVLATWHADTDEWTFQHRVARKRPTQKQSEQLAKMCDQAGSATRRREET